MAIITFPFPDFESISVAYLMSLCLSEGHQVEYMYYKHNNVLFNKRYDTDYISLAREIVEKGTHIAGFSCVTDNFVSQLKLAESLKKLRPEIICIFGGVHVTAVPEKVFRHDAVDCISIGEADQSLRELLQNMTYHDDYAELPDKPISGMVFKKNSKQIGTFEMASFPAPSQWVFPHKEPIYEQMPEACNAYLILTSRGCPYSCAYCYNSSSFLKGKKAGFLRKQSLEKVISELMWAKQKFSPQSIWFADDCFTTDPEWLKSFCEEYQSKVALPFACLVHPLSIKTETARLLKESGCYSVELGVQSLSKTVCNLINRKGGRQDVQKAINHLKQSGILVSVDHILGLPGDTIEAQEQSVLFYNEHRPFWVTVFWLNYFPKTAVTEDARMSGALSDKDIEEIEGGLSNENSGYLKSSTYFPDQERYYGIAFLLNWMPFLPKFLVRFLIKTRIYRYFRTNNYFMNVLVPRGIRSFHPQFPRRNFHLKVLFTLIKDSLIKDSFKKRRS